MKDVASRENVTASAGTPVMRLRPGYHVPPAASLVVTHVCIPTPAARPVGEGDGTAKRGNRENTDPHGLSRGRRRLVGYVGGPGSGSNSFTIRTSRMGSFTALVASLAAPSCSPSAEADGVSTVVYDDETASRCVCVAATFVPRPPFCWRAGHTLQYFHEHDSRNK